jgi:hypothetical protein
LILVRPKPERSRRCGFATSTTSPSLAVATVRPPFGTNFSRRKRIAPAAAACLTKSWRDRGT